LIVAAAFVSTGAVAQSGNVTLRISLDQDSAEVIKYWRRAQGIDPPDAAADERVRHIGERSRALRSARLPETPEAARLRRMLRTVELVDVGTGGAANLTNVGAHEGTKCVAPVCGY
jgi:hypothetical protein